jgi:hypothetical protein
MNTRQRFDTFTTSRRCPFFSASVMAAETQHDCAMQMVVMTIYHTRVNLGDIRAVITQ